MNALASFDEDVRQAKQTLDLCRVVDKQKSGRIASANFNRLAQVCGLRLNDEVLMRHTQHPKKQVNYEELALELMHQAKQ